MKDLYKIFDKLIERNIYFNFQSQSNGRFYNLSVRDIRGKEHNIHSANLTEVEKRLKVIWGHLLIESKPGMPVPAGFPIPR